LTGGPCLCRCLIPLRSLARRLAALRFCPRSGKRRGLQQRCFISGLYHAASELAVYASQSASRRPTQDSLAAGGQPFAARDWLPAGHHRSFNHSLHGILFSRLGLAQFPWKLGLIRRAASGLGRPGGLLPQGSHGPGRADFPHPVLQVAVSLSDKWSARLAPAVVETLAVSDSCPPTSPWTTTIGDSATSARSAGRAAGA